MFPRMFLVKQEIRHTVIRDAGAAAGQEMQKRDGHGAVRRGDRVAIAVGSRGIHQIDRIVAAVVRHFKNLGAEPFVFPAMGCHGGGTGEGQRATLEHLGIAEESIGCAVLSEIEPKQIAITGDGVPVYLDAMANEADHLMVINRIKPHSDFFGTIGSGLVKMLVIGCGKMKGADTIHEAAVTYGLEHMLRSTATEVLSSKPVLGGLGVVEGPTGLIEQLTWVPVEEMLEKEPELFKKACELAPRIPLPHANLLVIDWMGKNISGCGIDPFVIGRQESLNVHESYTNFATDRIYVRDLTDESLGNADGIGMADATSARLVSKLDYDAIRIGVLTSRALPLGRIPIPFPNDREALDALLSTTTAPRKEASLIRIRNTTELEFVEISENLLPSYERSDSGGIVRGPYELAFDDRADLLPMAVSSPQRNPGSPTIMTGDKNL